MTRRSALMTTLCRTGIGLALVIPCASGFAADLPSGATIKQGSASLNYSDNVLTITQNSQKLVIDWNSFDIAKGYKVVIIQPSSNSSVLNDILGGSSSSIYGVLTANGQLILVNTAGITFGASAQVSAGSLVASTLKLSESDFMAGKLKFSRDGSSGSIVNQGSLTADPKGFVALLAPEIRNLGVISANLGTVALASGDAVTLNMNDGRLVGMEIDPATVKTLIENKQLIQANGGLVLMSAVAANALVGSAINNSGTVEATSLTSSGGEIRLTGAQTIDSSGTLDASGAKGGGTVVVDAAGTTQISGSVSAKGGSGSGGTVHLLGDKVGLLAGAAVDASGDSGGGTVLVGGGAKGQDSSVKNASAVYMDKSASITADALVRGGGGKVVLWSNDYTGFYGSVSAKGGAKGGNGGSLETSSANNLQAQGSVNLSAAKGQAGSWLLDPSDITISGADSNISSSSSSGTDVFTATASSGTVSAATIESALNAGTNVTVSTTSSSGGNGDITVATNIAKTSGSDATLLLSAARNILVNANTHITSTSGALNVTLQSNNADTGGGVALNSGSSIVTNGGNITLGGGSNIATGYAQGLNSNALGVGTSGIVLYNTTLNSGGGNIVIRGHASNASGDAWGGTTGGTFGIQMEYGTINSGSGTISMTGISTCSSGCPYSHAVELSAFGHGSTITSSSSSATAISILGDASGSTAYNDSNGLLIGTNSVITATGTGGISLTGKADAYASNAFGISIGSSQVEAASGAITLNAMTNKSGGTALEIAGTSHIGGYAGTNIASSSSDITILADSQSWSSTSTLKSSGNLVVAPTTAGTSIGLGGSSGATLQLGSGFLSALKSGFNSVTIGRDSDTGSLTVNGATSIADKLILNAGSGNLTVNSALTGGSDVTLKSGGNITLNNQVTSGGTAVMSSLGHFINNFGSTAISAVRWLIYSAGPSGDTLNGLTASTTQWNANYASLAPASVPGSGNVLIYNMAAPQTQQSSSATSVIENLAVTPSVASFTGAGSQPVTIPIATPPISETVVAVAEDSLLPSAPSQPSQPSLPVSPVPTENQTPLAPTVPAQAPSSPASAPTAPAPAGNGTTTADVKTARRNENDEETGPQPSPQSEPSPSSQPLASAGGTTIESSLAQSDAAGNIAAEAHQAVAGSGASPDSLDSAEKYYAEAMTKALASGKSPAEAARLARTAAQDMLASVNGGLSTGERIARAAADAQSKMTPEQEKLFSTALGRALAKNKSFEQALTEARAAAQLDGKLTAAQIALLALASGKLDPLLEPYRGDGDAVRAAYIQALGQRLSRGDDPMTALSKAHETALAVRASETAAGASETGRLASGELPAGEGDGKALALALASGMRIDQARQKARAAQIAEPQASVLNNLATGKGVDKLVDGATEATSIKALFQAIRQGRSPEQAAEQARQAQQSVQSARNIASSLSSGVEVDQMLAKHTAGMNDDQKRLFLRVVGSALAAGASEDRAIARGLKASETLAAAANVQNDPLAALPAALRPKASH